jgi:dephospho-CoA kinase
MSKKIRLIAITGGFATGKSQAAKIFKKKGLTVLSADKIYHKLLEDCESLKRKLVAKYGRGILTRGKVDRSKLKEKIFTSQNQKSFLTLDKITHPFIIKELKKRIAYYQGKVSLLAVEVPLLYEAGLKSMFDTIVVVSSSLHIQIRRALDCGYTKPQILRLLRHQLPLEKKKRRAHFVIENLKTRKELEKRVDEVYRSIIKSLKP